jgi:hypothetical protein
MLVGKVIGFACGMLGDCDAFRENLGFLDRAVYLLELDFDA